MSIVRWNADLLPTFNKVFDDFITRDFPEWSRFNFAAKGASLPAVNIRETDDDFQLEVAAPGMQKKDFNIQVDNDVLTISAEMRMSAENKENDYMRQEFNYTSFQRTFTLPDSVDGEEISAKYSDGILLVSLPKKPEAKPQPAKTIQIS